MDWLQHLVLKTVARCKVIENLPMKTYGWGKKEPIMEYRVHRVEVKKDNVEEKLERFLNRLEGEVLSVFPYISPTFQPMGATAKVDFLLIVEKVSPAST